MSGFKLDNWCETDEASCMPYHTHSSPLNLLSEMKCIHYNVIHFDASRWIRPLTESIRNSSSLIAKPFLSYYNRNALQPLHYLAIINLSLSSPSAFHFHPRLIKPVEPLPFSAASHMELLRSIGSTSEPIAITTIIMWYSMLRLIGFMLKVFGFSPQDSR